jgi:chromatin segregation and condensation protein Rec8/ScpA/Scc1 (kleisin family)
MNKKNRVIRAFMASLIWVREQSINIRQAKMSKKFYKLTPELTPKKQKTLSDR